MAPPAPFKNRAERQRLGYAQNIASNLLAKPVATFWLDGKRQLAAKKIHM